MPKQKAKPNKGLILGGLVFFFLLPQPTFAANQPPQIGAITPASGISQPNQEVNLTTVFTDPDGWMNIRYAYFLINTSVYGANCFYGYYNQNEDKLYLRNNSANGWLGGFTPGSNNFIENSYAKLNCAKTTVSGQGNTLTIAWNIIFKPGFNGTKNCYPYVKDDSGGYQSWAKKGTWMINNPPHPLSLNPCSGAFIPNQNIKPVTTYSDKDGRNDIQAVYFLINASLQAREAFYGYYNPAENKLYLRNDADTAWEGGFSPGSDNTIENSLAKINCKQTGVSGTATTLALRWNIIFKPPFGGLKNTYLLMQDKTGSSSGFIQKGDFCIFREPIPPPE
jgi:hypothetical protein